MRDCDDRSGHTRGDKTRQTSVGEHGVRFLSSWVNRFTVFDLVALVVPFGVYVQTASRSAQWGDSTELTLAAHTLSIPHPTGYPLFLVLSHLASLVLAGDVARKTALISCVFVSVSIWALFRTLFVVTSNRWISLFTALTFAFFREVWDQSGVVEVYGLQLALTHMSLLTAVTLMSHPSVRLLLGLAFLVGLSFTNHMQTIFLVFGLTLSLAMVAGVRLLLGKPGNLVCCGVVFLIPLGLYGTLMIRSQGGAFFDEGQVGSLSGLASHMSGRQFQYRMFSHVQAGWLLTEASRLIREGFCQPSAFWFLAIPHGLVCCLGLVALRGRPPLLALIATCGACDILYTANYNIPDKSSYYLPLYTALSIPFAFGLSGLAERLGKTRGPSLLSVGATALLAIPLVTNWAWVDRSTDRSLEDYTADLAKLATPGSLLVTDDLTLWWGFLYRQKVLGQDKDRFYVNTYSLRLPWFLPFLRKMYPSLSVPSALDGRLVRGLREIEATGDPSGSLSQRLVDSLAFDLVETHLAERNVFLVLHSTNAERSSYGSFSLKSLGIVYQVTRTPLPSEPYSTDYAPPSRLRTRQTRGSDRIRVAKRYSTSLNRLGILLIERRRFEEAEKAFRRAIEYDPKYSQVYLNLGVLFSQNLNRPERAMESFLEFLKLAPDDPRAPSVQAWLGQYQQALVRQRPPH